MATINTTTQKNKILPLQDPNNPNAIVALQPQQQTVQQVPQITPQQVQPIGSQSAATNIANQSIQQAQQVAQQPQTQTLDATSQLTQQLLANPQQGFDPIQYVQSGITQYNREAADAMEAARQGLVGASGSSLAQAGLQDLALRTAEGRGELRGQLTNDATTRQRENLLAALTAGQGTAGLESDVTAQNVANLLSTAQTAQGQQDIEGQALNRGLQIALANQDAALQTSLTELQGKINMGLQLNEQDYQATQNELDRAIQKELASGNWQNALDLAQLQGNIDERLQTQAQEYATGERIATQVYATGERLSTENYNAAQAYLDRELQTALADQDTTTQKWVVERQGQLELQMQLNDLTYDEKRMALQYMYEDAQANNDVDRQKTLIQYQSQINLEEMEKEYSYDKAIEYVRGKIETDIANVNNTAAMERMKAELGYNINRDLQNQALEYAELALQEKGIDMQAMAAQYDQINNLIDQGLLDPSAAYDYVVDTLTKQGIDTSGFQIADQQAQASKAMSEDFDLMVEQYTMSHPEQIDVNTGELSKDGLQGFYDYYNNVMFGELNEKQQEEKDASKYLNSEYLTSATKGDIFKFDKVTNAPNGAILHPGIYSVDMESDTYGLLSHRTEWTVLVNTDTGERIRIKKVRY